MTLSPGLWFHNEVASRVDPQLKDQLGNPDLLRRTAGRLLEEAIELCLACGATGPEILGRTNDSLAKEAYKARVFPSELTDGPASRNAQVVEIADVSILLDYVRVQVGVTLEGVVKQEQVKLEQMFHRAERGELIVIDGCVYKRMQW